MDVDARAWYLSLDRPPAAPPIRLFNLVWEALYLPMALAAWLAWRCPDGRRRHDALTAWGWQLALNAFWTPLLFAMHQKLAAFAVSVALLVCLGWTLCRFWRLDVRAGLLLAPGFAWTGFTVYLGAGIYLLGR